MKKEKVSVIVVLSAVILVCVVIIVFQYLRIKQLEGNSATLAPGDTLPDLVLTNLNNNPLEKTNFKKGIKLLFIFKSPCSACNANLNSWKKLTQYFGDKIEVLGIILDGSREAAKLLEKNQVNFQLYIPEDSDSFRRKMRLRLNMAQTIIVSDNKIQSIRIGTLGYTDLEAIIKKIKERLKGA